MLWRSAPPLPCPPPLPARPGRLAARQYWGGLDCCFWGQVVAPRHAGSKRPHSLTSKYMGYVCEAYRVMDVVRNGMRVMGSSMLRGTKYSEALQTFRCPANLQKHQTRP